MPKNLFLSTFLSLTALASVLIALAPISTQAQTQVRPTSYLMTGSRAGLNFRDANCQIVSVLRYGMAVGKGLDSENITCNINGVEQKMVKIITMDRGRGDGYVAEKFMIPLNSGTVDFISNKARVTATAGLNLRDQNCRKVGLAPHKTEVLVVSGPLPATPICKVGSQYYMMSSVMFSTKLPLEQGYLMANSYLESV